jgi:aldehyde dehydrogenase (NAD+)
LSWASLLNNGPTCYLSTRILAPRTRYAEVVEAAAELAASMAVGDPTDPATRVGSLVSARQRERGEEYIAVGRAAGGRVLDWRWAAQAPRPGLVR